MEKNTYRSLNISALEPGPSTMLAVSLLLALCAGLALTSGDIADFDDTEQGYEFIYHDSSDLLVMKHADSCYFITCPDNLESLLSSSSHQPHVSPLQHTEQSLLNHVKTNRSGDVRESSLTAVRAKYQDILADFQCIGKRIFQFNMADVSFTPPTTTVYPTTQHNNNNLHHHQNHNPTPGSSHPQNGVDVNSLCRHVGIGPYPYPGRCDKYLACWPHGAEVKYCSPGLVFSPDFGGCIRPHFFDIPGCSR